jgi:hypothetical protein
VKRGDSANDPNPPFCLPNRSGSNLLFATDVLLRLMIPGLFEISEFLLLVRTENVVDF